METKDYLISVIIPPVGACKYGCNTRCGAPIGIFWLASTVVLAYGLLTPALDYLIWIGAAMWILSGIWTALTGDSRSAQCSITHTKEKDEYIDDPLLTIERDLKEYEDRNNNWKL